MNNTTTELPRTPLSLPEEVALGRAIRNVYIWVLVGVGVPGNLACLVTVLSMHVTTATFYVALLAVVDSAALLVKLVFHQLVTHRKLTTAACTLFYIPSFLSCHANWVLVLICFERFFAVCFPLKKQVYFTKRRVYISVIVLTVAMVVCFAPTPFFNTSPNHKRLSCLGRKSMEKFKVIFYVSFMSSLYFFLPFMLIAVFTTLIIIGLQRHRRARQRMGVMTTTGGGGGGGDGGVERSISIMLLCAGLVFLLLTLPACIYHLFLKKNIGSMSREQKAKMFLLYQVITLLSDVNHAINFFIYFLSAAKFRKRFMELVNRCLCFGKCRDRRPSCSDDVTNLTQISHSPEAKNTPNCTAPA
ncbi:hypothetical protein ACOMHN_035768 [Nucella lapillus]